MPGLNDFFKLVSMDLHACTARSGFVATFSALIFEPGFACMFFYRLATLLYRSGFRRLGKILWRNKSVRYGCYLHLHADIAGGLKLPHPVGVIVGEGVTVGEWVTLYQGVTLGQDSAYQKYPSIACNATIFPNAVVFGSVSIGVGAVVGAGSVVNRNVNDGDVVAGAPARSIACHKAGTRQSPHRDVPIR